MNRVEAMIEGGKRIGEIKSKITSKILPGVTPLEIDAFVEKEIRSLGDTPSFQMVPGYKHATCININSGIVHGIPSSQPFISGDVVKVDMGLYHQGFHLDTSLTVEVPPITTKVSKFIKAGQSALTAAINAAILGNTVYDISLAMQSVVEAEGYSCIRDLTGHGVGKELHMEPFIPCYALRSSKKDKLYENQTLAIEVMYAMGHFALVEAPDGWTLSTQDGSIAGMIEETVLVTSHNPMILTQAQ